MGSKTIKSVSLEWLNENLWARLSNPLSGQLRVQDAILLKELKALLNKPEQAPSSVSYCI